MNDDLLKYAKFSQLGEEIAQEVEQKTKQIADKGAKDLRSASEQFNKYSKGKYARGWKVQKEEDGYVLHNTYYQLPHLLEYPHPIIAYGKQVASWSGKAHIKPIEEQIIKEMEEQVNSLIDKDIRKL